MNTFVLPHPLIKCLTSSNVDSLPNLFKRPLVKLSDKHEWTQNELQKTKVLTILFMKKISNQPLEVDHYSHH